ncbi:4019_t:CDS:2 [Entrophospora sp. SA101]|nr:4019_t:CDS:2 [Entrophospora sp. SA101]CAJ0842053.1 1408_t:CDS:2 [Entrophospora sp. SA101]CAJ0888542.1 16232_t:CDS:2 [Entrophospora sp. SA101]
MEFKSADEKAQLQWMGCLVITISVACTFANFLFLLERSDVRNASKVNNEEKTVSLTPTKKWKDLIDGGSKLQDLHSTRQ